MKSVAANLIKHCVKSSVWEHPDWSHATNSLLAFFTTATSLPVGKGFVAAAGIGRARDIRFRTKVVEPDRLTLGNVPSGAKGYDSAVVEL